MPSWLARAKTRAVHWLHAPVVEAEELRLGREVRRVTTVPRAAVATDGYVVVVENGRSTVSSPSFKAHPLPQRTSGPRR